LIYFTFNSILSLASEVKKPRRIWAPILLHINIMENLQLQEFFVEGGNQQKSHVLLHITEPSNAEEESKGNFFAIAELNNSSTESILHLQKIIEEIESSYYAKKEQPDEHGLETVLKEINHEYWGGVTEPENLHCVVGAIRQKEIVFSYHGEPQILMFYKNKDGLYKKIDLIGAGDDQGDEHQLFSQIIQGKVSSGDYMLVTTPNVAKYFNQDRLQKITTTRPPRQIAEHLERVLSELRNDMSFGGLIIHLSAVAAEHMDRPTLKKGDSEKSLKQLFSTEKHTANTLAPAFMSQLNQKINGIFKPKDQNEQPPLSRTSNTITEISSAHLRPHQMASGKQTFDFTRTSLAVLRQTGKLVRSLVIGLGWVIILIIKFFVGLAKFFLALFFVITNFQKRRRNIIDNWRHDFQNRTLYFKQLPMLTKGLILGAIITFFIFAGSVLFLRSQQNSRLQNKQFEDNITAINTKQDSAESSLVYNDTESALSDLADAKNILSQTDCLQDKQKKERCDAIASTLDQLLAQLRKSYAAKIETLATWDDVGLNNILKINNLLIAYSSTSPSLYTYDLLTKQTGTIVTLFTGYTDATVPKENDSAILLYGKNEIAEYLPESKTVKKVDISFPEDETNIKSIIAYNRRLYSLDTSNQQIYKHDRIKTGFGIGQKWIKSEGNYLSDADDITIDGDIFITHQNGTVSKWNGGQKVAFNLRGLYPALSSDSNLWTYNDLQNLYVLDGANKRLIITDKDGNLINQIEVDAWTNPSGLVVEEQEKRAFVADDGNLYQLSLP